MSKIISSFYMDIFRLKKEYEVTICNDVTKSSLIARVNTILRNYNENEWKSLQGFYYESIQYLFTVEEKLILFVFLAIQKNNLKKYSFQIISDLIYSFNEVRLNPYNYEKYLDLFLSPHVYDLLLLLNLFSIFGPNSTIISNIISRVSFENVANGRYEEVIKMLSYVTGSVYSPVFQGDYTFEGIYQSVRAIMVQINQTTPNKFGNADFDVLESLRTFQEKLDDDNKNDFIERMKKTEEMLAQQKTKFVKCVLSQIQLFQKLSEIGMRLVFVKSEEKNRITN